MSSWMDDPNPDKVARSAGWRAGTWIIVALIFFSVIGAGVWAVQVATSDVKGRGDSVRIKNDAPNRIAAQERAVALHAEVLKADRNLDVLAADKKANPTDQVINTRYTGAVSYCLGVVADYDAHTQKYKSRDFIPAELPLSIDGSDPSTDCKETT